jgi:uracil-DNA glycosylase family 4
MSVLVDGKPNSPICVVGMAPGREELLRGIPFIGGSGRLLWNLFKRADVDRTDCYILNTIGELPQGKDGNPTPAQYDAYWDSFDAALAQFTGHILVPLGGAALWRCTGLPGGIESWRGYIVERKAIVEIARTTIFKGTYKTTTKHHIKGDPKDIPIKTLALPALPPTIEQILPTLHPAAILRTRFVTLPALAADLQRVGRAWRWGLTRPRLTFDTYPTIAPGPCAFDIETSGEAIIRVACANELATWSVPWGSHHDSILAQATLASTIVAHNIAFDAPRLAAAGVVLQEPWFDTMLAAAMLQPDLYKGLNAVASLYLDRPRWKHLSEADPAYYNANDASATLELYHALRTELTATKQLALFEGTIMPAVPVLVRMTQRGIRLAPARRERWLDELRVQETDAVRRWEQHGPPLRPSQTISIASWLYDDLKLPPQFNKYNVRTADENAIRSLLSMSLPEPVTLALRALLDYREAAKLRATYAENPLGDDGCVHPSYLPSTKDDDLRDEHGALVRRKGLAGTGRITARDPNIQNQPQSARRMYVPHDDELVLLEADYSQIELRVAAALSGDLALMEALEGDVHEWTRGILGCDRTRAKNVMYGSLYGAGPRKLVQVLRQYGVVTSEAECRALQNSLARAYPRLWEWRQEVIRNATANYYLNNPFGRRRYFWRGGDDAPAALDFLPQSTAADVMWASLLPLDLALGGCGGKLLATVHDSVLIEAPRDRCKDAAQVLRLVMEREFPQVAPGFRVPVNIKTGESWGEMEAYDG